MERFTKIGYMVIPVIIIVAGLFWLNAENGNKKQDQKNVAISAVSKKTAQEIHTECEGKTDNDSILECYDQVFKDYMVVTDAKQTLTLLDQLNLLGGYANVNCHPLSHKVGNIALHVYGTPLAASPYYLPTCYSGYYHGLLEEYIATEPDLTTAVTTACGKYDTSQVYFNWFQCTHGLGHGIMQYRTDDVLLSVKDCDLLDTANAARDICYGGVFMENITTDAKTGHPSKFIKESDPIYPCNIVDTQYKSSCYFLSSSMILRLNGYNFQAGFKSCDTAEQTYIYLCYQSMGRDVSGTYQNNIAKVNELCPQGSKDYIGDCYFGAVRDFINKAGQFDTAIPMCAATPDTYKSNCYNAVTFDLGLLKKGQDYTNVCNQMPENYKNTCLAQKKS